MKIVIDTNVVISAALGSKTCSNAIIKASRENIIEPFLIEKELENFLIKVQLKKKLDKNNLIDLRNYFQFFLELANITKNYLLCSYSEDLPDNHFLSVALHYKALLITGDIKCKKIAEENEITCFSQAEYIE